MRVIFQIYDIKRLGLGEAVFIGCSIGDNMTLVSSITHSRQNQNGLVTIFVKLDLMSQLYHNYVSDTCRISDTFNQLLKF